MEPGGVSHLYLGEHRRPTIPVHEHLWQSMKSLGVADVRCQLLRRKPDFQVQLVELVERIQIILELMKTGKKKTIRFGMSPVRSRQI